MSDRKSKSWIYPKPTGDVGRDRNARTLQFSCLLFALVIGAVAVVDKVAGERVPLPILAMAVGLAAAAALNRAGRSLWAARISILAMLLGATLLVFEARDGFRSLAMLVFPGMLLISVMLLDRASYVTTAGIVLSAVAALGIAEIHGLTRAIVGNRTPTSYDSIFYADLTLAIFAMIGSRIVGDGQRNIFDLRTSIKRLSDSNLELTETAKALKASESQARAQASELRAIMDAAPAIILVAGDVECRQVSGNRTAHVLMRQQPGTNLSMAAPEGERPTNRRVMKDGIELPPNEMPLHKAGLTGQPVRDYELHIVFEDGGSIDLLGNAEPVLDADGRPHGAVAVLSDITERKQAEAKLREREQQLASIYNTVRDVIFYLAVEGDGQFRFVSVNTAFLKVTGLSQEMVIGKTVNEVIPESSLTIVLEKCRQAVEERTPVLWEETSDYPTGRLTGEVSVSPVFDDQNTCTHLVGSVHDITERKQAEAKLRESEARLKNAERLAHIGNWHWDVKANRFTWSEEMFRIFSKPRDYVPNYEAFFQDIIPRDRERVERAIREGLAGKGENSLEFQITLPDGDLRTISIIGEVLESEGGLPARMFGACQDITDIRRAQEAAFASQKLESVGALATGIAHDFNNILGGVLAQADLALGELAAGTAPEEELKGIREGAIRGSEIVRQLMVYSGKESEIPELVDVARIVEDMLDLLRISISKHAVLETNLDKGLCQVRANPTQLRQIVMNLVTNASEAIGDRDGVISVRTACMTVGRDAPGANSEHWVTSDYLELGVSDTGCGIPLEAQARVFDPFFTTKAAGRGLGLTVVHGVVQSLGGMIRLESEPGKGTRFRILLPCAEAAAEATNGQMARTPQTAGPSYGTILVVEDEDPLRRPIAKMIQKAGFTVIEAGDGYAALQAIRSRQKHIDLLLLDVTLPGAPSREVYEQAKLLRPEMKVIVTSAYSKEMAAASLAGTVEHFIRKPYRLNDLMDLMQQSL